MIQITIIRKKRETYTVTKNSLKHEEPSNVAKSSAYGNSSEVVMIRDYAPMDVTEVREFDETLLRQDVADEAKFDLKHVIKAINGID